MNIFKEIKDGNIEAVKEYINSAGDLTITDEGESLLDVVIAENQTEIFDLLTSYVGKYSEKNSETGSEVYKKVSSQYFDTEIELQNNKIQVLEAELSGLNKELDSIDDENEKAKFKKEYVAKKNNDISLVKGTKERIINRKKSSNVSDAIKGSEELIEKEIKDKEVLISKIEPKALIVDIYNDIAITKIDYKSVEKEIEVMEKHIANLPDISKKKVAELLNIEFKDLESMIIETNSFKKGIENLLNIKLEDLKGELKSFKTNIKRLNKKKDNVLKQFENNPEFENDAIDGGDKWSKSIQEIYNDIDFLNNELDSLNGVDKAIKKEFKKNLKGSEYLNPNNLFNGKKINKKMKSKLIESRDKLLSDSDFNKMVENFDVDKASDYLDELKLSASKLKRRRRKGFVKDNAYSEVKDVTLNMSDLDNKFITNKVGENISNIASLITMGKKVYANAEGVQFTTKGVVDHDGNLNYGNFALTDPLFTNYYRDWLETLDETTKDSIKKQTIDQILSVQPTEIKEIEISDEIVDDSKLLDNTIESVTIDDVSNQSLVNELLYKSFRKSKAETAFLSPWYSLTEEQDFSYNILNTDVNFVDFTYLINEYLQKEHSNDGYFHKNGLGKVIKDSCSYSFEADEDRKKYLQEVRFGENNEKKYRIRYKDKDHRKNVLNNMLILLFSSSKNIKYYLTDTIHDSNTNNAGVKDVLADFLIYNTETPGKKEFLIEGLKAFKRNFGNSSTYSNAVKKLKIINEVSSKSYINRILKTIEEQKLSKESSIFDIPISMRPKKNKLMIISESILSIWGESEIEKPIFLDEYIKGQSNETIASNLKIIAEGCNIATYGLSGNFIKLWTEGSSIKMPLNVNGVFPFMKSFIPYLLNETIVKGTKLENINLLMFEELVTYNDETILIMAKIEEILKTINKKLQKYSKEINILVDLSKYSYNNEKSTESLFEANDFFNDEELADEKVQEVKRSDFNKNTKKDTNSDKKEVVSEKKTESRLGIKYQNYLNNRLSEFLTQSIAPRYENKGDKKALLLKEVISNKHTNFAPALGHFTKLNVSKGKVEYIENSLVRTVNNIIKEILNAVLVNIEEIENASDLSDFSINFKTASFDMKSDSSESKIKNTATIVNLKELKKDVLKGLSGKDNKKSFDKGMNNITAFIPTASEMMALLGNSDFINNVRLLELDGNSGIFIDELGNYIKKTLSKLKESDRAYFKAVSDYETLRVIEKVEGKQRDALGYEWVSLSPKTQFFSPNKNMSEVRVAGPLDSKDFFNYERTKSLLSTKKWLTEGYNKIGKGTVIEFVSYLKNKLKKQTVDWKIENISIAIDILEKDVKDNKSIFTVKKGGVSIVYIGSKMNKNSLAKGDLIEIDLSSTTPFNTVVRTVFRDLNKYKRDDLFKINTSVFYEFYERYAKELFKIDVNNNLDMLEVKLDKVNFERLNAIIKRYNNFYIKKDLIIAGYLPLDVYVAERISSRKVNKEISELNENRLLSMTEDAKRNAQHNIDFYKGNYDFLTHEVKREIPSLPGKYSVDASLNNGDSFGEGRNRVKLYVEDVPNVINSSYNVGGSKKKYITVVTKAIMESYLGKVNKLSKKDIKSLKNDSTGWFNDLMKPDNKSSNDVEFKDSDEINRINKILIKKDLGYKAKNDNLIEVESKTKEIDNQVSKIDNRIDEIDKIIKSNPTYLAEIRNSEIDNFLSQNSDLLRRKKKIISMIRNGEDSDNKNLNKYGSEVSEIDARVNKNTLEISKLNNSSSTSKNYMQLKKVTKSDIKALYFEKINLENQKQLLLSQRDSLMIFDNLLESANNKPNSKLDNFNEIINSYSIVEGKLGGIVKAITNKKENKQESTVGIMKSLEKSLNDNQNTIPKLEMTIDKEVIKTINGASVDTLISLLLELLNDGVITEKKSLYDSIYFAYIYNKIFRGDYLLETVNNSNKNVNGSDLTEYNEIIDLLKTSIDNYLSSSTRVNNSMQTVGVLLDNYKMRSEVTLAKLTTLRYLLSDLNVSNLSDAVISLREKLNDEPNLNYIDLILTDDKKKSIGSFNSEVIRSKLYNLKKDAPKTNALYHTMVLLSDGNRDLFNKDIFKNISEDSLSTAITFFIEDILPELK